MKITATNSLHPEGRVLKEDTVNKPVPAAPAPVAPIRHHYDPTVRVTKKTPATKFRVGDEFRPFGVDSIGTIASVSGGQLSWYYAHEPSVRHSGSSKELLRIIGLDK